MVFANVNRIDNSQGKCSQTHPVDSFIAFVADKRIITCSNELFDRGAMIASGLPITWFVVFAG